MPRSVTQVRIFVASPGDVEAERTALSDVVAYLQQTLGHAKGLYLKPVKWETDAYPQMGRVQAVITEQLDLDSIDIFVGIFWKRFGTPTGEADSGTQEEFQNAYDRWKETRQPHILFYFCDRSISPMESFRERDQIERVMTFREQYSDKGLYWSYEDVNDFAELARQHLYKAIEQVVEGIEDAKPVSPVPPTPVSP
ncbi:MAG: DUF4062 domain-containing protein, partial [Bacteroidota bacterium]